MTSPTKVCVFCLELLTSRIGQGSWNNQNGPTSVVNVGELLGLPPMNPPEKEKIGMCNSCLKRIEYLSTLVQKVRNMQLQINDVLKGVYRDLENDPFIMAIEQAFQPFVEYRKKAATNRNQYVFELRPVGNLNAVAADDERLPEVEPEPVTQLTEIDSGFLCDKNEGSEFDLDFGTENLPVIANPDVPEPEEANVFVCSHDDAEKGRKCGLVFKNKNNLDAHQASHTLRIQLNHEEIPKYMRARLRTYWRNHARTIITEDSWFRCVHIDCRGSDRMTKEDFQEHLKEKHDLYACPEFRAATGKRVRSCLDLFDSPQQVDEHIASHKPAKKPKFDDMDPQTPDVIRPIATVCQNIVKCSGCSDPSKRYLFRWAFGGHAVRRHKFFVCLHEDGSGTCLYSVQTKDSLVEHYEKEHSCFAAENVAEKRMLFLDPESSYSQCYVCGQIDLNTAESFVMHMREEHDLLVCGQRKMGVVTKWCHVVCGSEPLLKVHRASCNLDKASKEQRYKSFCSLCMRELMFINRESWLQHVREDHNAFLCNVLNDEDENYCVTMTVSRALMKKHVEEKHTVDIALESAKTSDSAIQLYSEGILDEIQGLPLNGPAVCQICSISFENFDQEWAKHIRSHGLTICDLGSKVSLKPCLRIFFSVDQLRDHINSVHTESRNRYLRCITCKLQLPSKLYFVDHMSKKHLGKATRICPNCGRTRFRERYCLCLRTFGCDLCDKKFYRQSDLKLHKSRAHGGLNFTCAYCKKCFIQKITLRQHMHRIHKVVAGYSVVSCSECDKTFTTKGDRDRHHKLTHGERKFKCDQCGWVSSGCGRNDAFRMKQNLEQHVEKVHNQLRPFICYICGESFKTNSHMKTHIRKHEAGQTMKPLKARDRRLKTPPPLAGPGAASLNIVTATVSAGNL